MFSKTNQFNVTTRRYGLGELETMLASPRHHLGMVALRDRFGDLGIIAAFVLAEDGERLHIDSLLMSCRAMGRGVETAIMNYIKQAFAEREELSQLTAEFIPTPKNKPAANYFAEQDFQPAGEAAGSLFMLEGRDKRKTLPLDKNKRNIVMEENLERICLIVSDVLDVDTGSIAPDSAQGDIPEWDSLAQLRIVTALEQEFGVKPTMREIPELNSIPAITRYLGSASAQ